MSSKNNYRGKTKNTKSGDFRKDLKSISKQMKKEKFQIKTYTKEFETFEEGIKELMDLNPDILSILGTDVPESPAEAASRMFDCVASNFPNPETGENIFWSINLSANRCVIKTNMFISFGWKLKYTKAAEGEEKNTLTDISMQISLLKENKDLTDNLTELDWKES